MLQVLRWCRVVSQRSGKYENFCACTYLCVYVQISPRWETLPYAFFFFENFPSLSLSIPVWTKWKKPKSSSCLLFDGVAHLDNKEVNLVRGQLLTSHFWYFAAPPEPDEQKQCRFHPPCPIAVQRETVGNRHKAPFQECCICVFSFFFSALTTKHLQNFSFMSHSETAHKKCLCAAAHKHWLCWGSWGLCLHGFYSCVTSLKPLISSRKEQVTHANLLPKSHMLWGQAIGKQKHHSPDLGEEATISASSPFWKKQTNGKWKPGCCCF